MPFGNRGIELKGRCRMLPDSLEGQIWRQRARSRHVPEILPKLRVSLREIGIERNRQSEDFLGARQKAQFDPV